MTILMKDTVRAADNEIHIIEGWVRPRSKWLTASHWVNIVVDGVVWLAVLMAASGLGLLIEAIYDTVRYGHPR